MIVMDGFALSVGILFVNAVSWTALGSSRTYGDQPNVTIEPFEKYNGMRMRSSLSLANRSKREFRSAEFRPARGNAQGFQTTLGTSPLRSAQTSRCKTSPSINVSECMLRSSSNGASMGVKFICDEYPQKTKKAVLFPGQGAQYVGMGVECAGKYTKAKALFDEASNILGYDLLKVCAEGPAEKLNMTDVCQPAIFVSSMAAAEKWVSEGGNKQDIDVALGLSLGEYSALCFADCISFSDGVKITKERGRAMQEAAEQTPSSMIAIVGVDNTAAEDLARHVRETTGEKIDVANYLCNGNYILSGSKKACEETSKIAKPHAKAKMARMLSVAGAFHTSYMDPAVPRLRSILSRMTIIKPKIPVISNVDAKCHSDPKTISQLLQSQVTSPVLWENSIKILLDRGLEEAYEIGPGAVLAGIMKRVDKTMKVTNVA